MNPFSDDFGKPKPKNSKAEPLVLVDYTILVSMLYGAYGLAQPHSSERTYIKLSLCEINDAYPQFIKNHKGSRYGCVL